eukprot:gene11917-15019_t
MRRLFPLLALLVLLPVPSASLKANGESVDSNPAVHSIGINASNRNKTSPIAKVGLTISEEPEIHGATVFGSKPNQLHASEQPPSAEKNSCDDLPAVPDDEKCQFVREHCESDSRINYPLIYYCYVQPKGLTLVAMGNGAPDLSSNITALQTGQWGLSTGAITGAAMFVQCIIASEVIRIAGGAAMFVQCIVASKVIRIAGGVLPCLCMQCVASEVIRKLAMGSTQWGQRRRISESGSIYEPLLSPEQPTPAAAGNLGILSMGSFLEAVGEGLCEGAQVPAGYVAAAAEASGLEDQLQQQQSEGTSPAKPWTTGWQRLEQQPEETSPPKHWTTGGLHDGPPGLGNISPSIVCSDFVRQVLNSRAILMPRTLPRGASPLLFPPPGLGHTHGGVQGGLAQGQGMAGSPAGGGRAGNHPGRQSMPGSTCRGRGLSHPSMVLDSRTYKLAVFADTLNCEVEVDVNTPFPVRCAEFFSYSLNPRQTQTQLVSGSSFIRPRATAQGGTGLITDREPQGNSCFMYVAACTQVLTESIIIPQESTKQAAVAGARPPRLQWRLSTALPSTPTIADHVHDYDGFSNFRLPLKIQLDVVSEEGSMARSSRSVESNTAGTMSRGQSGNSGRRPSFPRNRSQASLLGPALSLRSKSYTLAGSGSSLAGLEAEIGGPYVPRTGGGGGGPGRGQPPKREETLLKDIHQRSLQKLDLEVAVEADVEKEDSSTSEVESSSFYAGFEPVTKGRSLYKQVVHMATLGACEEWDELPTPLLILRIISCPLLLPVYFTLRATIPFVDPAGYNRYWLLVSMLLSPLTVCRYMDATSAVQLGAAAAIGCSLLAMVWAATYDTDPNMLPAVDFGTRFDFGTPFFSVVGFILGAMWIDTVASEAVGIIVLCAQLLNVHPSVMGLTLLAWGNSLGDLASNTAMAKQGFSNMALTACFASPLFNMLISFAFGAYSYFLTSGEPSMDIQLQLPVGLGCVFLLIYNFAIVAVGLFYNGIIPRRFYIFARTWYCLYLLVACYADFADFI